MAGGNEQGGEKTEKPSAKRLKDAVKDGDILQSRDLGTALVIMVGAGWFAMAGPMLVDALRTMLIAGLRFQRDDVTDFSPTQRGAELLSGLALPIGGLFLATIIAAIAAPAMLGSLGFRTSGFAPKASKLNPASGLKRMFGMQGLMELGKSIAKVLLLGTIGIWLIWEKLAEITHLAASDLNAAMGALGSMFVYTCLLMGGGLIVIAMIDVPSQIFQRNKRLSMTKQDVKDEHKESEGSPELKGHIRRRQMETLSNSTRQAVKEANVVIVNPTHFAVALRYKPGFDAAPVVVARGRDAVAAAIRDLAGQNEVPVLQYPELARAVYFTSRTGQVVDEALYMAVATVLAFLFRLDNKMATDSDRPSIAVPDHLRFDMDGRIIN
jgi:flagellar biosynthesis protein FlhB